MALAYTPAITTAEMAALLRSGSASILTWRHCRELQARLIHTTAASQKLHKKQPQFVHGEKTSVSKLIKSHNSFLKRHIGPSSDELLKMLRVVAAKVYINEICVVV